MVRRIVGVLLIAALGAGTTVPVRAGEGMSLTDIFRTRDTGSDPKRVFAVLDADGDGRVDHAEFRERRMYVFGQKDLDRDTRLSRDEFPTLNRAAFDAADSNGDGQLSGYEFNQADWARFEAIDGNGDGVITLEEFLAFRHQMQ